MNGKLSREEIALRILCSMAEPDVSSTLRLTENDVRCAFKLAEVFERVSDEVGGRPSRFHGRTQTDEDDD